MFTSGRADDYNVRRLVSYINKYKNGLYHSSELAAYAFGEKYNRASIDMDREHGAVILKVIKNGNIAYTWNHVFIGGKRNVIFMWIAAMIRIGTENIISTRNKAYAATVHTHASCGNREGKWNGNGTFFFSNNDMKYLPKNKYLITPDGAMHYAEGTPSF